MIYLLLAHGFEEIEAITVADLLRRADLTVKLVGIGGKTITGAHGITIHCDISHKEIQLDKMTMLVLPGGMPGTTNLETSPVVQKAIDTAVEKQLWIGAICAAPMILGRKNLLVGKTATIFPGMEAELVGATLSSDPVVVDGKLITGNGPAAALPFALALIEALKGKPHADKIGEMVLWHTEK